MRSIRFGWVKTTGPILNSRAKGNKFRTLKSSKGHSGPLKQPIAFWKYGDQTRICERLRITPQALSDILHRRTGVGVHRALVLEEVTKIPVMEWLLNKESSHPAFFGEPLVIRAG